MLFFLSSNRMQYVVLCIDFKVYPVALVTMEKEKLLALGAQLGLSDSNHVSLAKNKVCHFVSCTCTRTYSYSHTTLTDINT